MDVFLQPILTEFEQLGPLKRLPDESLEKYKARAGKEREHTLLADRVFPLEDGATGGAAEDGQQVRVVETGDGKKFKVQTIKHIIFL